MKPVDKKLKELAIEFDRFCGDHPEDINIGRRLEQFLKKKGLNIIKRKSKRFSEEELRVKHNKRVSRWKKNNRDKVNAQQQRFRKRKKEKEFRNILQATKKPNEDTLKSRKAGRRLSVKFALV